MVVIPSPVQRDSRPITSTFLALTHGVEEQNETLTLCTKAPEGADIPGSDISLVFGTECHFRLVALKRAGCQIGSGFIGFHSHVLCEGLDSSRLLLSPKHVH